METEIGEGLIYDRDLAGTRVLSGTGSKPRTFCFTIVFTCGHALRYTVFYGLRSFRFYVLLDVSE